MAETINSMEALIDRLGGNQKVAALLKRSPQNASMMRKSRLIPQTHQPDFVLETFKRGLKIHPALLSGTMSRLQQELWRKR